MTILDRNDDIRDLLSTLGKLKKERGLTWMEIAEEINDKLGLNYDESSYRKAYKAIIEEQPVVEEEKEENVDQSLLLKKLKVKIHDERVQLNADIRDLSREDTLKEIAHDFAKIMNKEKILPSQLPLKESNGTKYALLNIGDWHYGLEVDNEWNVFNPDIARDRVAKMVAYTKLYCKRHDVTHLIVNGLGDYISGNIHLPLRIRTREDVITQTMMVAEILAEMLVDLQREGLEITFLTVYGNHGRVTPNKKDAIPLENFERLIDWYLEPRLVGYDKIHLELNCENARDMITYSINGWNIGVVHGEHDGVQRAAQHFTLMNRKPFDLIITGHKHHLSTEETNGCIVVGNPSLIGVDDYSQSLRATSYPAQTLIIVGNESPVECMYYMRLD